MNELDRAITEAMRTPSAAPALYRALSEGELWALVPFYPEVENEVMQLKEGMAFPFVQLQDEEGPVVPIYSSAARLRERRKKGRVLPKAFSMASLPAKQLLEIIGKLELRAELNRGCKTGTLLLPPDLLRDLASGVALEPLGMGEGEEHALPKLQAAADVKGRAHSHSSARSGATVEAGMHCTSTVCPKALSTSTA